MRESGDRFKLAKEVRSGNERGGQDEMIHGHEKMSGEVGLYRPFCHPIL